jgi:hypothetical protein
MVDTSTASDLPRVLNQPSGLPLYALIGADGAMRGAITFDGQSNRYPGKGPQADGSYYLPVFGDEAEADTDLYYFDDQYRIDGDRVIRTRTVCSRERQD